jgi:hypothetical protein
MNTLERNIDLQHLFNEIRSKNGFAHDIRTQNLDIIDQREFVASDAAKNDIPKDEMKRKIRRNPRQKEAYSEKFERRISPNTESKAKKQETILRGRASRKPSLIQSTHGTKGDFELVVPLTTGGLAHYRRNNDLDGLPWNGPVRFGTELGGFDGASLIQSDFGSFGNLEVVAVDSGGCNLLHFWRDSGPSFDWHGPIRISKNSVRPMFSGSPAMIWNNFDHRGNFEVVVPSANGGFYHFWRDNDDPDLPWYGPFEFARDSGHYDAVGLIQSNFGDHGNREMVARSGDRLDFFWCDSGSEFKWNGPETIARGVTGDPSIIQSTFGNKGNFELVVPIVNGSLAYFWRDNDDDFLRWHGPLMFGMNAGKAESAALIQSNFGEPGHLELIAQIDGQLSFFWRDSGPDFRWNGPQYLTF